MVFRTPQPEMQVYRAKILLITRILIRPEDERTIVLRVVPGKAKEGVLGFEIADLQDTVDLCG